MPTETSPATDVSQPQVGRASAEHSIVGRFPKVPWAIAIMLAGLAGWLAYSFPPREWHIPDSMTHIGALSPASEQAKLQAVVDANRWKNTMLRFTLAGLGIGLVGIFLNIRRLGQRWPAALATLSSGVIAGALAGSLGLLLRQYLDRDHPIPLISAEMRPLFADGLVFALLSILLMLPVSILLLFEPLKADRHKGSAVPLAGLLTGFLVPVAGALILSGYTNTGRFPPDDISLTALWFATMSILTALIVVFYGNRADEAQSSVA